MTAELAGAGSLMPMFRKGDRVDMYMFISEEPHIRHYGQHEHELVWIEKAIAMTVEDPRQLTYTYRPSEAVHNNGSVYLHVLFAVPGMSIDNGSPDYNEDAMFGGVLNLIAYLPKPKNATGVNLLSGDKMEEPEPTEKVKPDEIVSYIKPNATVQIVDHFFSYQKRSAIPAQVAEVIQLTSDYTMHYPIVYFNEFWMLRDKLIPMNETVDEVTMHLEVGWTSFWYWQMMEQMDKSFAMQRKMGMQSDGESDEVKRVFLEGNPVLLAITMVVSALHTVFDMLAFKNDIGFWKDNKSMEGLSARTVLINAFCQLVILLYLFDNQTSMVILFSSVLGTGIEFWKVTKAMKVSMMQTFPYIKFEDRASYTETKTKQYDKEATRYLSYVLYPLIVGYAIYSLVYKTHKSWYSWILNSAVGAVYTFGFILMCPQLYLNYKLKSVAHLPWRQMTYKFLNTIIDDLFAFVIKMPLLHRLSVFRDDLIFVIFLYQRWIYRVDKSRANEFGFVPEPVDESKAIDDKKDEDADEKDNAVAAGGDAEPSNTSARKRKGGKASKASEEDASESKEVGKKEN